MASPIIPTQFDPSGGSSFFNQGWRLIAQQVFNKDPAGTPAQASYQDAQIVSLLGLDLWPQLSIGGLYAQLAPHARVYYISFWRNPPSILGTGIDYFRAITVQKA